MKSHNLRLRPHVKTHKSCLFTRWQQEYGIQGITVSKVQEGLALSSVERDQLLAYPLVDSARLKLAAESRSDVQWSFTVDSLLGIESLEQAFQGRGVQSKVLVDMDLGMRRKGVQTKEQVLELAIRLMKSKTLSFHGLFVYPGQVLEPVAEQAAVLGRLNERLEEIIQLLGQFSIPVSNVSSGSTPTLYQSHLMPHVTEIRPGTYIFNDVNTLAGGFCSIDDIALWLAPQLRGA